MFGCEVDAPRQEQPSKQVAEEKECGEEGSEIVAGEGMHDSQKNRLNRRLGDGVKSGSVADR